MRVVSVLLLVTLLSARPVIAQSILRDAETEAFLDEISAPLIEAAGLEPRNVDIILINDKSINAFVAGGQAVYIHSGLIDAATTANEVQGVIAHELGHVVGGHAVRFDEGASVASGISIASLILAAAAMAAGAGEAGMGILSAGQQAAMGKFLAYTRGQEGVADASGAQYLSAAGITGRGSISFFKKLQNFEFRLGIPQEDSYGRTHPLSGERISVLEDTYSADPAWTAPLNPKWESDFKRIKAKLTGYLAEPQATMRDYPETDKSVPARYARAYAWHKSAYPQKALDESSSLVALASEDPYFLELHGQILLESGRPADAIIPLRKAVSLTGNQPLIAAIFGHALIATEDKSKLDEAARVLKAAVTKDNQNPFAWYQLGVVYEQKGDTARAALASAERYLMEGSPQLALPNAQTAMAGLPEYSPDWIRAQDINMVAEAMLARVKKRRR
jgi:predicted Zn-dependent protease